MKKTIINEIYETNQSPDSKESKNNSSLENSVNFLSRFVFKPVIAIGYYIGSTIKYLVASEPIYISTTPQDPDIYQKYYRNRLGISSKKSNNTTNNYTKGTPS